MSDLDEAEDGRKLADRFAAELKELDPTHELLRYIYPTPEEGAETDPQKRKEDDAKAWTDCKDRFWPKELGETWQGMPGLYVSAAVWSRYWPALADAVKKLKEEKMATPTQ
ncbi:MAG: hypothetical protein Q7S47_00645 [bacterium]|nr:hypothetical protein [bacterium]